MSWQKAGIYTEWLVQGNEGQVCWKVTGAWREELRTTAEQRVDRRVLKWQACLMDKKCKSWLRWSCRRDNNVARLVWCCYSIKSWEGSTDKIISHAPKYFCTHTLKSIVMLWYKICVPKSPSSPAERFLHAHKLSVLSLGCWSLAVILLQSTWTVTAHSQIVLPAQQLFHVELITYSGAYINPKYLLIFNWLLGLPYWEMSALSLIVHNY